MSKSQQLDAVPRTYAEAVRVLAAAHVGGGDRIDVYSVPDPDQRVVRLIEVSDVFPQGVVERTVPPSGLERIVPVFPMGPAKDFPFRSEIVQITPEEWRQLREGKLRLNRDWGSLDRAQRVEHAE